MISPVCTVAFVVDTLERMRLMRRIIAARPAGQPILIITTEPLAHLRARIEGLNSFLLRSSRSVEASREAALQSSKAIEVLNGEIGVEEGISDYISMVKDIAAIIKLNNVDRCIIWNGQQLIGRASRGACDITSTQTRFLEISNLPSKLFVDDCGVNAESRICYDINFLRKLPDPGETVHQSWLKNYEAYKRNPVPQSVQKTSRRLESLANHILKIIFSGAARRKISKLNVRRIDISRFNTQAYIGDAEAYVFLPLQVTSDTQIKLHSDIDNDAALDKALKIASERGERLVVKIHPAERDVDFIRSISSRALREKFYITSGNTTDLIKAASLIVTINSTVGLEGLMYGKQILTLGRCLYSEFNRSDLRRYIHSFLVDGIDYFASEMISEEGYKRIVFS